MAILINIGLPQWLPDEDLRDRLAIQLPGIQIYCGRPTKILSDVTMLIVAEGLNDFLEKLPNLKLIQKMGAGVNNILANPDLPKDVKITRLSSDVMATEISEYCLTAVLNFQRNMFRHIEDASQGKWNPLEPRRSVETTVSVLGLGRIGERTAQLFSRMGFNVLGWSRTLKDIEGISCMAGQKALDEMLSLSDYVVAILPSTQQTTGLFNRSLIKLVKPGAVLINVGRGDLIDEQALLNALDQNRLNAAVLDVFREEPLPHDHPFWQHPKVIITPHVSGWHIDEGVDDVAQNYKRITQGHSLLNEINREQGY